MATAQRYDHAKLEVTEHGPGFLRARVTMARPGVFPYLRTDGSLAFEAKLPEELFSAATQESAKGKPITDGHPPRSDSRGLVTPQNYKQYACGSVGDSISVELYEGEEFLTGYMTAWDAALIQDIIAKKKNQLSIGFELEVDPVAGEFKGQRYDAVQRKIRINHLAVLPEGRAGEKARVHLDGADGDVAVMVQDDRSTNTRSDGMDEASFFRGMMKFFGSLARSDSADPQPGNAGTAAASAEPAKESEEVTRLKAELEAAQAVVAEKTKQLEELQNPAKLDAAISSRLSLVEKVRSIVPDVKHDGVSDRDLKRQVIAKVLPSVSSQAATMTDVQVDAYFDAAMNLAGEKAAERDSSTGTTVAIDEATIATKKQARLTMNQAKGK